MSFFVQLIEATDVSRRELEAMPPSQDMLMGRFSEKKYIHLLKDLYHIVLNFCPIMAASISRLNNDVVLVRDYLYDHIQNERGHEQLVLDDLACFDIQASDIVNQSPSYPVQAMLGFNYAMQDRQNPCAVLGMVYVLEIIASVYGGQMANATAKNLGREVSQGFSFLDSHAAMDMDHMSTLRKLLQSIDLIPVQKTLIDSVGANFYLMMQILKNQDG